MANSDFNIAISNCAGVPVVELAGEVSKRTLAALNDILAKLARAGHYNVMINVKQAAWQNLNSLMSLRKVARLFKTHYGNLDLIAEAEQISGLLKLKSLGNLVHFHISEGHALTRIKKLPAPSVGVVRPMPAHLTES